MTNTLARSASLTAAMLILFVPLASHAADFHVLLSFSGNSNGGFPEAGIIRDKAGNLYGSTYYGGSANAGTIFTITVRGRAKVLYTFSGGQDGANPFGNLTLDKAGNLYGTTENGGYGTVFRLARDGSETVLHSFDNGNDGGSPVGDLLLRGGKFYGVTTGGGAGGGGAVFRLTTHGKETVIYSFTGGDDGYEPVAGVISDGAGNLYGTASQGGANEVGTVYRISTDGTETVVHAFAGGSDGANPAGPLIIDAAGNLYGTTEQGGADDAGTIFRIAPDGTESILYSFTDGRDGADPLCGLVLDTLGNLYGSTPLSEADGNGSVFKLAPDGALTVLHSFAGQDGANPQFGLTMDPKSDLLGTAPNGGAHGYGVVFKLKP